LGYRHIVTTLSIDDIPDEGIGIQLVEEPSSLKELLLPLPRIDFSLDKPVRAHLRINKSDEVVLIRGRIQAELILQCSRCLEDYRFPLDSDCEVTLFPFEGVTPPQEAELNKDDLRSSYYYEGEIDLSSIIREQILLDIPYKPLCRVSCKGLCPICGEDLNRGSCSCKKEVVDERFAPLKGFKIGRGGKGH
jgi:uncharacterized protein